LVAPAGTAANWWPQSHANRRGGIWRLHFGHGLDHDFWCGGFLRGSPAAFRAAREMASARATAHCGWVPVREYDALPQTGQRALFGSAYMGTGFLSLMVFVTVSSSSCAKLFPRGLQTEQDFPGDRARESPTIIAGGCRLSAAKQDVEHALLGSEGAGQ
jgi:hypothetical protein